MGIHLGFLSIARVHPLKNEKDFQDYTERLKGHARQLSQALGHLRRGLKKGWTNPAHINELVIKQLSDFLKNPIRELPHFQLAAAHFEVLGPKRDEIEKELEQVLKRRIRPALQIGRAHV